MITFFAGVVVGVMVGLVIVGLCSVSDRGEDE
jgi:hypothetical protein